MKNFIEIMVKDDGRRSYEKVPNGPFPISKEKFLEIRKRILDEMEAENDPLSSGWATYARNILKKEVSALSSFDMIVISNSLCVKHVKVSEMKGR